MQVAMLASVDFPPREGIGFYIWNLSMRLQNLGHSVQIVTRGTNIGTMREVIDGIPIWKVRFLPVYPLHVHLHGLFVDRLFRLLEPELDIIHAHTPLVKCPSLRLPIVVTVHTSMRADVAAVRADSLLGVLAKLQAPVSVLLEQQLFGNAKKIAAVSTSVAHELGRYGIPTGDIAVLGNGADTDIFYPNGSSDQPHPDYFFTAGRLAPRKGLEDLIRAAVDVHEQYPSVQFWIAGSGPMQARLSALITRYNLKGTVRLLGHVSDREQMRRLYQQSIAYVHPAHYEGLPTVLLEAMACGRPVITTAVSGSLDVIENGVNGVLIPPREPDALAHAMQTVLNDRVRAAKLATNARCTIKEHYSWDIVSRNYARLYEDSLGVQ